MDPSTVGSDQFGQLWKASLPGNYQGLGPEQIYSQPLVYTLNDGVQYVFVATTQNNIYKINAKTGAVIASRNLHVPFLTSDLNGCVDVNPTVGVTVRDALLIDCVIVCKANVIRGRESSIRIQTHGILRPRPT